MKTTRKLKALIAAMLTLAVAFTNAALDSITAEAKVVNYQKDRTGIDNIEGLNETTVTMKVGDTKKVDLIDESDDYSIDSTKRYAWASSDETIVSMQRAWDISTIADVKSGSFIYQVDTSRISFVLCGAFSNKADEIARNSNNGCSIGFGALSHTVKAYDQPLTTQNHT